MRVLCLFANAFPYGDWEPFLETEVEYYAAFDRVEIFSLSVREDQYKRRRPIADPKIRIHAVPFRAKSFYALKALRAFLDASFYREVADLARAGRLSVSRLVQVVVFLSRAHSEAAEIAKLVRKHDLLAVNDDVVLYSYRFAYQPYLAEKVAAKLGLRSTRRVARAHGADLYEEVAPHKYIPLRSRVASSVDEVHVVSAQGRGYLARKRYVPPERVRVSYLGTRDFGIAPTPTLGSEVRILTCSTLVPVKRLDRLVDALKVSRSELPIRWIHYGDGPLRAEIEACAQDLPEHVSVEFRGAVDNRELLSVYQTEPFHALINVSESEGLPVSMMEACSFGIPVIATNVGGVGEIVESGVNGTLLPSHPAAVEIADAISTLADMDPAAYLSMRAGARRVWEWKFQADVNYEEFVQGLLSRFPAR